ncbi:hypothetical protein E8E11_000361 [Didymella keratinophila]|nr:hypothetical protein E8E11_000361 [Didymella keratinophila]
MPSPSMSIYADINALKQSSAAEDNFNKQLREGLLTIFNGMETESYRRGDALEQLEQRLRNGGHLRQSTEDLEVKVRQLEMENENLQGENRLLRRQAEKVNAAQQNNAPGGLTNKRKKVLSRIINTAITHGNEAHAYVKARANSMAEDASMKNLAVASLADAERSSVVLKQALNNLVDMVIESGNSAATQDLNSAMRCWGGIHRQNDRLRDFFEDDRALVREQILDLRNIAEELGLDMKRVSEDGSF